MLICILICFNRYVCGIESEIGRDKSLQIIIGGHPTISGAELSNNRLLSFIRERRHHEKIFITKNHDHQLELHTRNDLIDIKKHRSDNFLSLKQHETPANKTYESLADEAVFLTVQHECDEQFSDNDGNNCQKYQDEGWCFNSTKLKSSTNGDGKTAYSCPECGCIEEASSCQYNENDDPCSTGYICLNENGILCKSSDGNECKCRLIKNCHDGYTECPEYNFCDVDTDCTRLDTCSSIKNPPVGCSYEYSTWPIKKWLPASEGGDRICPISSLEAEGINNVNTPKECEDTCINFADETHKCFGFAFRYHIESIGGLHQEKCYLFRSSDPLEYDELFVSCADLDNWEYTFQFYINPSLTNYNIRHDLVYHTTGLIEKIQKVALSKILTVAPIGDSELPEESLPDSSKLKLKPTVSNNATTLSPNELKGKDTDTKKTKRSSWMYLVDIFGIILIIAFIVGISVVIYRIVHSEEVETNTNNGIEEEKIIDITPVPRETTELVDDTHKEQKEKHFLPARCLSSYYSANRDRLTEHLIQTYIRKSEHYTVDPETGQSSKQLSRLIKSRNTVDPETGQSSKQLSKLIKSRNDNNHEKEKGTIEKDKRNSQYDEKYPFNSPNSRDSKGSEKHPLDILSQNTKNGSNFFSNNDNNDDSKLNLSRPAAVLRKKYSQAPAFSTVDEFMASPSIDICKDPQFTISIDEISSKPFLQRKSQFEKLENENKLFESSTPIDTVTQSKKSDDNSVFESKKIDDSGYDTSPITVQCRKSLKEDTFNSQQIIESEQLLEEDIFNSQQIIESQQDTNTEKQRSTKKKSFKTQKSKKKFK